jgi:LysM repeat protein/lysophospholipase L1-like esterase
MRIKNVLLPLFLIGTGFNSLLSQPIYWNQFEYQKYPWIDSNVNVIQTHRKTLIAPFMAKLKRTNKQRVHILHIGDSHVQADIFTHETRTLMGGTFGHAGRGMVFPYTTARTHTAADYRSRHTGKWYYARNVERYPELPIGVTGITSRTYEHQSAFKLSFKEGAIRPEFTRLRILMDRTVRSFDLRIIAGRDTVLVDVFKNAIDSLSDQIWVDMPKGSSEYLFELVKNDTLQSYFEIYGISIESPDNRGLLYSSVGINGAGHYSIMRENKLPQHLTDLKPDAIILDVGANDFYQKGMDQQRFKDNLVSIIEMFKTYAPDALIILSNSQDIHRGGYSVRACSIFSTMISDVAKSENVAFYDWYRVAGGNQSMKIWKSLHLANRDGVHLTRDGYELKGSLIYQSFGRTYRRFFTPTKKETSIIIPCLDPSQLDSAELAKEINSVEKKWLEHTVKKGETAWGIAQMYNISVIQLKEWNRLGSYALKEGQKLKVFTEFEIQEAPLKRSVNSVDVRVPKKPNRQNISAGSVRYHTIQRGETLYSIARKYRMSVSELKQLNNMRNDNIRAGKRLKVK